VCKVYLSEHHTWTATGGAASSSSSAAGAPAAGAAAKPPAIMTGASLIFSRAFRSSFWCQDLKLFFLSY
jgi:hypothetical protein